MWWWILCYQWKNNEFWEQTLPRKNLQFKKKEVIKSKEKRSSLHPSASKDNNARRKGNRKGQIRQRLQLRGLYIQQQQQKKSKGGLRVVLAGGSDHSLKKPEKFPLSFTVVRFVSRQNSGSTTPAFTTPLLSVCYSLAALLLPLQTSGNPDHIAPRGGQLRY